MTPELDLRNVDYSLGGRPILEKVSLQLQAGETVAIIGPSGAGKTTILRMILGFLRPDAGEVWLHGRRVDALTERQLREVRRDLGVVFQGAALFTSLTVFENVAYSLEEAGMAAAPIRQRVAETLAAVGLAGFEERMPDELSGGQAQRVAVARAIISEPRIMLYDEPTQGLDPIRAGEVVEQIQRLARTGVTSVVVTHQLEYAQRYAGRVVVLVDGRVLCDGPVARLRSVEQPFVQAYAQVLGWEVRS